MNSSPRRHPWPIPRQAIALLQAGVIVGDGVNICIAPFGQFFGHLLALFALTALEIGQRLLQVLEVLPTQDAGVVSRVTTAFGMALGAIARSLPSSALKVCFAATKGCSAK
jgi:hypothetical protein